MSTLKVTLIILVCAWKTLADMEAESCADLKRKCPGYAKRKYCSNKKYRGFMTRNCRKSCGLCVEPCQDLKTRCPDYAKSNYCTHAKYKKYMAKNCRLSCGFCQKPCEDLNVKCSTFAKYKLCKSKSYRKYMETNCRKSCHLCQEKGKTYTEAECGIQGITSSDITKRIVGGNEARLGEWPWMVGIKQSNARKDFYRFKINPFCGGALVSPQIVLTAAHCFKKKELNISQSPKDYVAVIGDLDQDNKEEQEEEVPIRKIILHDYDSATHANDIAILVLSRPVVLRKYVNAVCLPPNEKMVNDCYVTGWGRLLDGGMTARVLQKLKMPVVSSQKCKNSFVNYLTHQQIEDPKERETFLYSVQQGFGDRSPYITDKVFCAGHGSQGKDACKGDSGGPLMCKQKTGNYVLNGIVSWGVGCAKQGMYGVYTNVYKYLNWIRKEGNLS